jgi:hypothetical protein
MIPRDDLFSPNASTHLPGKTTISFPNIFPSNTLSAIFINILESNDLCYLKIQMINHASIEFLKNRVLDEKFLISPCGRTSFDSMPGEWPRQTK